MGKVAYGTDMSIEQRNRELRNKYKSPLIKWYQSTMTKEEKYKLGMMTVDEYYEWQAELEEEKALAELATKNAQNEIENTASNNSESGTTEGDSAPSMPNNEPVQHTFWENDDGDRSNLSNDSYAEFLAQNGIDVSNRNAVDVSAIINESNNQ